MNDAAVNLYREGVATYVSKQIVKGLNESVYYHMTMMVNVGYNII